jgi:hypothetical protein
MKMKNNCINIESWFWYAPCGYSCGGGRGRIVTWTVPWGTEFLIVSAPPKRKPLFYPKSWIGFLQFKELAARALSINLKTSAIVCKLEMVRFIRYQCRPPLFWLTISNTFSVGTRFYSKACRCLLLLTVLALGLSDQQWSSWDWGKRRHGIASELPRK